MLTLKIFYVFDSTFHLKICSMKVKYTQTHFFFMLSLLLISVSQEPRVPTFKSVSYTQRHFLYKMYTTFLSDTFSFTQKNFLLSILVVPEYIFLYSVKCTFPICHIHPLTALIYFSSISQRGFLNKTLT